MSVPSVSPSTEVDSSVFLGIVQNYTPHLVQLDMVLYVVHKKAQNFCWSHSSYPQDSLIHKFAWTFWKKMKLKPFAGIWPNQQKRELLSRMYNIEAEKKPVEDLFALFVLLFNQMEYRSDSQWKNV